MSSSNPDSTVQSKTDNDRISHEPGKSYNIIAKLDIISTSAAGERVPLFFAIAAPYITLDGLWRAPMQIDGFGDPSPEIYGIDSVQCLNYAIGKIRTTLSQIASQGNKLTWKEGNPFDVDEYFKAK